MSTNKPPFRADVVGSLLRTAPMKEARAKREKGEITAAQFKEVEDREIEKIIKKQEDVGLKVPPTANSAARGGISISTACSTASRSTNWTTASSSRACRPNPAASASTANSAFRATRCSSTSNFSRLIPGLRRRCASRRRRRCISGLSRTRSLTALYADRSAIFDDLANTYRQAIRGFYDAGCRYLQFDDTAWAYLCSQAELKKARDRGLDADRLQQDYARVINGALEGKPADMVVTTHVCRGNFRSTWISEGGYEPVAEIMLGQVELRRLFPRIRYRRAPAASSRCGFCPRATRSSCSAWSPRSPARWRRATTSSSASTKRPNSPHSTSLPVAAMRLRLDRGRQRARRRRTMGEAADGG